MDMSEFRVTYDGPALQTSEMDVRELAPALLAVGDLLSSATTVLYGDKIKPQINVKGSFKTGSFGIDFVLSADLISRITDIFTSREANAAANALALLGFVGLGVKVSYNQIKPTLLDTLKWMRGRKIQKVEIDAPDSIATLYIDNEKLEIETQVLGLLRDVSVREAVERMLSPLKTDGITDFYVGDDKANTSAHIVSREVEWFSRPEIEDELIIDENRKMIFSIVSLAFKEDNKWRLSDGTATINATITDSNFISKVNHNQINFAKGDILVCNVKVRQWQTGSGAKTEYEVFEVLEHRTSARQISLPGI